MTRSTLPIGYRPGEYVSRFVRKVRKERPAILAPKRPTVKVGDRVNTPDFPGWSGSIVTEINNSLFGFPVRVQRKDGTFGIFSYIEVTAVPAPVKPCRYLVALALALDPSAYRVKDPARYVAEILEERAPNVDGSVTRQVGFGSWGVEVGVQIVSTTIHGDELFKAVQGILRTEHRVCAYVEIDGEAFELSQDGILSPIEGYTV